MTEPAAPVPPDPDVQAAVPGLSRPPRRALRILLMVALCLGGGAALALGGVQAVFGPGPLAADTTLVMARGSSVQVMTSQMAEANVIYCPFLFRLAVRLWAPRGLQAGEYHFTRAMPMVEVLAMIRDGRSVVRKLTIPEGLTSMEIVALLQSDPALDGTVAVVPDEGTLLPETYHYSYGDARGQMLERMKRAASATVAKLWDARAEGLPYASPREAVIMASLVEKETGPRAEERARVAGVFLNRLRIPMRLQSDPTVIYAITSGAHPLDRGLTKADLASSSPYNTYTHDGLPPGPICNPGKAALDAALHPERNDYLYFVADGSGGHVFARDLDDHNRNVAHWISLNRP